MPAEGYLFNMPLPKPGAITRHQFTTKPEDLDPAFQFPMGGIAGKLAATAAIPAPGAAFVPMAAGDSINLVAGFLVRDYPMQNTNYLSQGFGSPSPDPHYLASFGDRLVRGHMAVLLYGQVAAVKGGQVYIRLAAGTGANAANPIGGVEAGPDGGNCVALPRCFFNGAADSYSTAEIEFNM